MEWENREDTIDFRPKSMNFVCICYWSISYSKLHILVHQSAKERERRLLVPMESATGYNCVAYLLSTGFVEYSLLIEYSSTIKTELAQP